MSSHPDWEYPEVECPPGETMDMDCLNARKAEYKKSVEHQRNTTHNALSIARTNYQTALADCADQPYYHPAEQRACRAAAARDYASKAANIANRHARDMDDLRDLERNGCTSECCVEGTNEQ